MSCDPKKFLHVLAAANEKMDLQVKAHHNQKHQMYRQVSFTLQESIPISYHHQFQEFCPLSALLILPMGLEKKNHPSLLNALTVTPFHTNHMTTFLCHVTTSFDHHVISFLQSTVQNSNGRFTTLVILIVNRLLTNLPRKYLHRSVLSLSILPRGLTLQWCHYF